MLQDTRHAFRLLISTPAWSAIAIFSIALSVGATSVVFTAVKSVLIEPMPYARANELVQLRTENAKAGAVQSHADWVSWNDMEDLGRDNHTLESVATYRYALFNLLGDAKSPPEALYGAAVTANLFPTLGVKPMLGRNILPEEDQLGRNNEMILSYGLWTRRFDSDRSVIGRSVEVNGHNCTIIGVMPQGFDFPMRLGTTVRTPSRYMDFWTPLGIDPARTKRGTVGFSAIARLRPGVSLEQARQDVAAVATHLSRDYPATNQDRIVRVNRLIERTLGFAKTGLLLLMASAVLFMLIGCANVANLLLSRALARNREITIRLALGAGQSRIARQLITESCILALLGGLGGYILTLIAWTLLPSVAPMTIPRLAAARADASVLLFTLAISLWNGILFGLAPSFRTTHRGPVHALSEDGARGSIGMSRSYLRSALVVVEVSVAVILVVGGGLLTGAFIKLLRTDTGLQDPNRLLASIIVPSGDQYNTRERRAVLYRHILDSVRALPGVQSAATVDALPFSGENHGWTVDAHDPGDPNHRNEQIAEGDIVSADYLQTIGARLLEGRYFRADDMDSPRDTAIVNDVLAARSWPGEDALGKGLCANCAAGQPKTWYRVVGVVQSIRHAGLDQNPGPEVYVAANALGNAQFLVVRTNRPAPELAKAIRFAVAGADPKQPVFLSATMSTLIGYSVADRRFVMTLLAITGCLALLLAAAGIYGVVSYLTSLRTPEIGVRIALGATPANIHWLIFRQGMSMVALGIGIGLGSSLILVRSLRGLLTGLAAIDPVLVIVAVSVVALTAALACLIPARRATKIDPMTALRA